MGAGGSNGLVKRDPDFESEWTAEGHAWKREIEDLDQIR